MNDMRKLMEAVNIDESVATPEKLAEYIKVELNDMRIQYKEIGALIDFAKESGQTATAASLNNVQGEMHQAMRMLRAALADVGTEL